MEIYSSVHPRTTLLTAGSRTMERDQEPTRDTMVPSGQLIQIVSLKKEITVSSPLFPLLHFSSITLHRLQFHLPPFTLFFLVSIPLLRLFSSYKKLTFIFSTLLATSTYLLSGSADNTMKLWLIKTGECLQTWEFTTAVKRVAWSEDNSKVSTSRRRKKFLF